MDEAARICARLFASKTCPRQDVRDLEHPAIRAEVEERLRRCGLALATSAYSDHIGIRLAPETTDVLDVPSNFGLGADACALLTVLWARLALQHRVTEDTKITPDPQLALLPETQTAAAEKYAPTVRFETLVQEFGTQLGGTTRLKGLLAQLRRLRFVSYHHLDAIAAGPLLELAIDGEQMIAFIRSRVLAQFLTRRDGPDPGAGADEPTDPVLAAISAAEDPLSIGDLEQRTGMSRTRLRRRLVDLRRAGQLNVLGPRNRTRYAIAN
jgi:hypothetical protein